MRKMLSGSHSARASRKSRRFRAGRTGFLLLLTGKNSSLVPVSGVDHLVQHPIVESMAQRFQVGELAGESHRQAQPFLLPLHGLVVLGDNRVYAAIIVFGLLREVRPRDLLLREEGGCDQRRTIGAFGMQLERPGAVYREPEQGRWEQTRIVGAFSVAPAELRQAGERLVLVLLQYATATR